MQRMVIEVVVTTKSRPHYGDEECYFCGEGVWRRVPHNHPQVCQECADREVWQFSHRHKGSGIETERNKNHE